MKEQMQIPGETSGGNSQGQDDTWARDVLRPSIPRSLASAKERKVTGYRCGRAGCQGRGTTERSVCQPVAVYD